MLLSQCILQLSVWRKEGFKLSVTRGCSVQSCCPDWTGDVKPCSRRYQLTFVSLWSIRSVDIDVEWMLHDTVGVKTHGTTWFNPTMLMVKVVQATPYFTDYRNVKKHCCVMTLLYDETFIFQFHCLQYMGAIILRCSSKLLFFSLINSSILLMCFLSVLFKFQVHLSQQLQWSSRCQAPFNMFTVNKRRVKENLRTKCKS